MSDEVRQSLDALDACFQEQRDALVLAEALPPLLAQLRALYPVHRTAFSAADIRLLKRIPAIVEAAEDFSDLAGDVPGVRGDGEIL